MSDREATLRRLAAEVDDHDAVNDAFLAKSFTDLLLVVDAAGEVPPSLRERLADHGLRPAGEVYEEGAAGEARSAVGDVGDGTRHQFVDVETRGEHQSYVVE
ncbi:MAG: hypothetical protein ABEJ30_03710 [Halorientalis sp.]